MERRDLLKATALGAASASVPALAAAQTVISPAEPSPGNWPPPATIDEGGMKYRILGATGQRVSIVGMGGFHLAKPEPNGPTTEDAIRIVRTGIDNGINFCDCAWDYNGGESEIRLGKALRDGYRQKAFLMTKIDGRTAASATAQLETSLRRLQTDHLDLLQFHEIIRWDDPDRIFADGGALEAMLKAQQQGKFKYIGFTGHKSPKIHLKMFQMAAQHHFHFDTVQMPVNVMDSHFDSFQQMIFPIAQAQRTAVLAMKTFGDTFIYDAHVAPPAELLHYGMSQPVAVVITGCDKMPILQQALEAARTYQPMSAADQQALLAKTAEIGKSGSTEKYKVSHHFDSTMQHPGYLTQT
ncbi:aldo/keto reductase [Acidisoma sp.]|uniref:aldo/keto reductase n=1 Tax=Acidisoma sp. TaxID=1872115 RepID=UPI003AFFE17A